MNAVIKVRIRNAMYITKIIIKLHGYNHALYGLSLSGYFFLKIYNDPNVIILNIVPVAEKKSIRVVYESFARAAKSMRTDAHAAWAMRALFGVLYSG